MAAASSPALQIWKLVFPACVTDGPRPMVVKTVTLRVLYWFFVIQLKLAAAS